jgi:hypothetical protein
VKEKEAIMRDSEAQEIQKKKLEEVATLLEQVP